MEASEMKPEEQHKKVTTLHSDCHCCDCKDCKKGFKMLLPLKGGLNIYRDIEHMVHKDDTSNKNKGGPFDKDIQSEDNIVITVHNTRDKQMQSAEFLDEIDINKVGCPRCRYIMERARLLLEKLSVVEKNELKSVCDSCVKSIQEKSRAPCEYCQKTMNKIKNLELGTREEDKLKKQLISLLADEKTKVEIHRHGKRPRAYSDIDISKTLLSKRKYYDSRLDRPRSSLVEDSKICKSDIELASLKQKGIDSKKEKIRVKICEDTETIRFFKEFELEDIHSLDTIKTPQKPILKTEIEKYVIPPPLIPVSHQVQKTPYRSGLVSDTALGFGTTGMRRTRSDESLITSFSKITDDMLMKNLKYLFPRMTTKETTISKTSSELIQETRAKFREQAIERIRIRKEIQRRKHEQALKKIMALGDIEAVREWAEKEGINFSSIDLETGKIKQTEDTIVRIQKELRRKNLEKELERIAAIGDISKIEKWAAKNGINMLDIDIKTGKFKEKTKKKDDSASDKLKRGKLVDEKERKGKKSDEIKESGDKQKKVKGRRDKEGEKDEIDKKKKIKEKRDKEGGKDKIGKMKKIKERRDKGGTVDEADKKKKIKERGEKEKGDTDKKKKEKEEVGGETDQKKKGRRAKGEAKDEDEKAAIKKRKTFAEKMPKHKYKEITLDDLDVKAPKYKPPPPSIKKKEVTLDSKRDLRKPSEKRLEASQLSRTKMEDKKDSKVAVQKYDIQKPKQQTGTQTPRSVASGTDKKPDNLAFEDSDIWLTLDQKLEREKKEVVGTSSKGLKKEVSEQTIQQINLVKNILTKHEKVKSEGKKLKQAQVKTLEKNKKAAEKAVLSLNKQKSLEYLDVRALKKKKQEEFNKKTQPTQTQEEKKSTELETHTIKMAVSGDDMILKLVAMNRHDRPPPKIAAPPPQPIKMRPKVQHTPSIEDSGTSDIDLDAESLLRKQLMKPKREDNEVVLGQKIALKKDVPPEPEPAKQPALFQTAFTKYPDVAPPPPDISEQQQTIVPKAEEGPFRYALSDRKYIENGWTKLPVEKIVRKMNVYRMRPTHPAYDWFVHNLAHGPMRYDTGEKMVEVTETGRGRWYYKNGRIALDYYDSEELNAQKRFVVYGSGELDERGRSQSVSVLAMFDYLGNGVVFDDHGKIRLKYNQSEGVVLDRELGPVSHWQWHSLNEPPELQQVMIDTQLPYKDPAIFSIPCTDDKLPRQEDEEMLAIEFENYIKSTNTKPTAEFKPHQIRMKSLKINDQFSLKVIDQETIYLLFREGSANMKLNLGMKLDHNELLDTSISELNEVTLSFEKQPAMSDSMQNLQKSLLKSQNKTRVRMEREMKLRFPAASVDNMTAAVSKGLHPPLPSTDPTLTAKCRPLPMANNLYYNTRLI